MLVGVVVELSSAAVGFLLEYIGKMAHLNNA